MKNKKKPSTLKIDFYFLNFKETKKLFEILEKYNIDAMFVGGCVRDSIYNSIHKNTTEISDDFDIAVNCNSILYLIDVLNLENIKYIPSGIKYGSITIFINHKKFELTILRRDINSTGRHCEINNINSFKEDAKRRDFTMNSIYISKKGEIFDYFNGIEDIKNKDVIFIGNPQKRISEDYLRILRYYRFCAKYKDLSDRYYEIIKSESVNIKKLSTERIKNELIKIIESKNSIEILKLMLKSKSIININININDYELLLDISKNPNLELRLYILFDYKYLIDKFNLEKRYKKIIKIYKEFEDESIMYCAYKNYINNPQDDSTFLNDITTIKKIKLHKILLSNNNLDEDYIKNAYKNIDKEREAIPNSFPVFPLKFCDLPHYINFASKRLKSCEKYWVNNNFNMDKGECLKYIDINQEF